MTHPPLFRFETLPAQAMRVIAGANVGDPIGLDGDVVPGDLYRIARSEYDMQTLTIADSTEFGGCVADGSDVGTPGTALAIRACHTLMSGTGDVIELLVLELGNGPSASQSILPLSRVRADTEYELVGSESAAAPERFADIASVSFLAGTHLTLAGGQQVCVENLAVGDKLLTRDHGAQPIRWIGSQTRRATGAAAPVRITAGTMNTSRDLRLSPQHRLFVWQRMDELGTGRAEVMVKAELLINGTSVVREEGGHIDSYQIVFDGHEIIFAEGIAVESLMVTGQTRALLPEDLELADRAAAAGQAAAVELQSNRGVADVADSLSRASQGRKSDASG